MVECAYFYLYSTIHLEKDGEANDVISQFKELHTPIRLLLQPIEYDNTTNNTRTIFFPPCHALNGHHHRLVGSIFAPLGLGVPRNTPGCSVHSKGSYGSSTDLQKHAVRFIHITAMHIILFDIAAFVTLIWITQSLNTKDTLDDVNTTAQQNPYPALFILSPLILLFFIFAALQPELLGRARNYQVR
jgi:hypothetical protein